MDIGSYKQICDLANHVSQIPVHYYNEHKEMVFSCPHYKREEDFLQTDTELIKKMFVKVENVMYPVIFSTDLHECLAVVPVFDKDKLIGLYVIGPVLTTEVDDKSIVAYAGEKNLPLQYTFALIRKYKSIPVLSLDRFGALPKMIYFYIYRESLDTSDMTFLSGGLEITQSVMNVVLSETIFNSQEINIFSRGAFVYEKNLAHYIESGDAVGLKRYVAVNDPCRIPELSKKDPLRQSKYMFIYYLNMAMNAAVDGGANAEEVFAVGELFSQKMEIQNNLVDVDALRLEMLMDLAERVESNTNESSSPIIKKCCCYITEHIYSRITISDISDYVGLSENYLSSLFHKVNGMTISTYIQKQKIREAKRLMETTTRSLAEISDMLSFSSQCYFCTIFKKVEGITPKNYIKFYRKSRKT